MAKSHGSGKIESAASFASRAGRRAFILDDPDVVRFLKIIVDQEGGQSAFARHHGFDPSHINKVLNGRARMTKAIAKALGLRRIYIAE
jgi:hypothetical protein